MTTPPADEPLQAQTTHRVLATQAWIDATIEDFDPKEVFIRGYCAALRLPAVPQVQQEPTEPFGYVVLGTFYSDKRRAEQYASLACPVEGQSYPISPVFLAASPQARGEGGGEPHGWTPEERAYAQRHAPGALPQGEGE